MYHVKLQIHVFGVVNGSFAVQELKKLAPIERFSYEFRQFSTPDQSSVSGGDLLILADGADPVQLMNIRMWRKDSALSILCADSEALSRLLEKELSLVERLWPLPLTAPLLRFQFRELVQSLQVRKNAWLSQNYLDTLINHIPPLVWFKDARGSHLKVNQSFCEAVGKPMSQIENRGHYYIWDIPEEEYQQGEYICLESETETMEKGCTCLFDENVKTKQGMRKFNTYKTPIYDEDGVTILGTVGIASDVTDYLNLGSELDTMLNNIPLGILLCDTSWDVVKINQTMKSFFPELTEDVIGENYLMWKGRALSDICENQRSGHMDATVKTGDQPMILEFSESPLEDVFHNVIGYLCLFRDVTLTRTYEAKIAYYANTDSLTGLSTRRSFFQQLSVQEVPGAIFFFDLDDFKSINDQYGHQTGDLALQVTADALRSIFPGQMAARTGGDEFVVAICGSISRLELAAAAEALQKQVAQRAQLLLPCPVTVSIGVARCEDDMVGLEELLHQADEAMYAAKRGGKSGYRFFEPAVSENT